MFVVAFDLIVAQVEVRHSKGVRCNKRAQVAAMVFRQCPGYPRFLNRAMVRLHWVFQVVAPQRSLVRTPNSPTNHYFVSTLQVPCCQ